MQKHLWIFVKRLTKIKDEAFEAAGAKLVSAKDVYKADLILKVRAPETREIKATGSVLIGLLELYNRSQLNAIAKQAIATTKKEIVMAKKTTPAA